MRIADVAVIVPVYNRATGVLATLASVAAQATQPKRLIVVDDGSTDDTVVQVRNWIALAHPQCEVLLIEQANQGAGAARNRGLLEAGDCKYVAYLDSDDRWPRDFLTRAVERLEAVPDAVAATADRVYHRSQKRRLGKRSSRNIERHAAAWLIAHSSGITSSTLFRSAVARNVGGYNAALPTGQDVDFFLRVSLEGPWLHLPGEPVHYYVGFTAMNGEEGNLSRKYSDRQRRWVRIRERFLALQNSRAGLSPDYYLPILARLWHKTACAYKAQGRHDRAAVCFRKAARYQPTRWWSWLQCVLACRRIDHDVSAKYDESECWTTPMIRTTEFTAPRSAAA